MDKRIPKYFEGELSSTERIELLNALLSDPELKEEMIACQNLHTLTRLTPASSNPEAGKYSYKQFRQRQQRKQLYRILVKTVSYAAALVLIFCSGYAFFYRQTNSSVSAKYIGGDGLEADVIELPDGSKVSLGTKTRFYCDEEYGVNKRIVYLEGEAYFEVAKQKEKPFIVKTLEHEVEALGTKFNVNAYTQDSLFTVTLEEGAVRLSARNLPPHTVLRPDEQFIYNRNMRSATILKVDARQFTAWTSGYYYFPEQSLEIILHRLSHVYGITFIIHSEALKKRMFTGTFYRGQSIKDIMEIINLSIPIKYNIKENCVSISE